MEGDGVNGREEGGRRRGGGRGEAWDAAGMCDRGREREDVKMGGGFFFNGDFKVSDKN